MSVRRKINKMDPRAVAELFGEELFCLEDLLRLEILGKKLIIQFLMMMSFGAKYTVDHYF